MIGDSAYASLHFTPEVTHPKSMTINMAILHAGEQLPPSPILNINLRLYLIRAVCYKDRNKNNRRHDRPLVPVENHLYFRVASRD